MTKKDFELIASTIANTPVVYGEDSLSIIAEEFARVLAQINPRFDRKRFLKACEVII